jgi:hypothetical protein
MTRQSEIKDQSSMTIISTRGVSRGWMTLEVQKELARNDDVD